MFTGNSAEDGRTYIFLNVVYSYNYRWRGIKHIRCTHLQIKSPCKNAMEGTVLEFSLNRVTESTHSLKIDLCPPKTFNYGSLKLFNNYNVQIFWIFALNSKNSLLNPPWTAWIWILLSNTKSLMSSSTVTLSFCKNNFLLSKCKKILKHWSSIQSNSTLH